MKICIVCEGSYPYVVGGVSGWVHTMIRSFPETEFILLTICADRSIRGKFVYELPENLTQVYEIYLQDADWCEKSRRHTGFHLKDREYEALMTLVRNRDIRWDELFEMFRRRNISVNDLLMGPDFLHVAEKYFENEYPQLNFSDFLWTLRSIYLPMFLTMKSDIPKADLYHCVATGYAGLLGAMAKERYHCGLLISEHGIYTREREEELIRAEWVKGVYKNIWIEQFRKMSRLAYDRADLVTSLFAHAKELQIELGCPEEKIRITPNGVDPDRFSDIIQKQPSDAAFVNIGAVLRVTPIKDVKTLILAFSYALHRETNLRLWIMGPGDEDPEYMRECESLVASVGIRTGTLTDEDPAKVVPDDAHLIFTGRVDVTKYLGRMDFTVLTSISEGQPLTILESFAAHRPVIATDVGNCRGLLYGEGDSFGDAGILTHVMNTGEIAAAMNELAEDPAKRERMGENGYRRFMDRYKLSDMHERYRKIYGSFTEGG